MSKLTRTIISMAVTIGLSFSPQLALAADRFPKTTEFISTAFNANSGSVIQLFDSNQWGLSLEALLQRKAAGVSFAQQIKPIRYLLATTSVVTGISSKPKSGYLFGADQQLLAGRAGLFLATSSALKVPNMPLRYSVVASLKSSIGKDGSLSSAPAGAIDYAWVIFGLLASGETGLANQVSVAALKFQNVDGGFRSFDTAGSVDATGLIIQALVASQKLGSAATQSKRANATKLAVSFLQNNDHEDNHFVTAGLVDVNATAYAAMAIKAAIGTKSATPYIFWLRKQVGTDGGLITPWSKGNGDVFATVQSYLAISSKSYLDVLK